MKLSILSLAVASAGLLASASPAPFVVLSNTDGTPALPKPVLRRPPVVPPGLMITSARPPCNGARLRQKASSMITSFRIALGFSTGDNHVKAVEQEFKILPFIGTPNVVKIQPGVNGKPDVIRVVHNSPEHAHGHRFRHMHNGERPSFLMRVHIALMSLGPWEGRAVAFVLGCGIGVLLRMAWVLVVLTVRGFRSPRSEEEEEHVYAVIDMDAEEIFVAPPTYTYPVEKAEAVAPAPAEETN